MIKIFERQDGSLDPTQEMKLKCDSQSLSFYSDIANFLSDYITGFRTMSVLDVGARTAAGTALLRAIHHPRSFARLKLNPVTALDLDTKAIELARQEYRDLEYLSVDVTTLVGQRQWDMVLSSHTIEHVANPHAFVGALEKIAKHFLVIACPFAEESLSVGHIHSFNSRFFEQAGFQRVRVYRSLHWHGGMACIAMKEFQ